MIDGNLEEALDLRAVQVHGQDPIGPRRLDAISADAGPDRDAGLVLFVSLGVGEKGDDRGDLRRTGPLECVDPEQELDEIVVDGIIGALDDENVAAAHVFEHANEHVALAEDVRFRLSDVDAEVTADRLAQLRPALPAKILSSP